MKITYREKSVTKKHASKSSVIIAEKETGIGELRRQNSIKKMQGEKNLPKNKLNLVLPLSFLIGYYVYESIIFATNKNRSMPNDNIAPPTPNEPLEIGAKKSKKRLDKLV